MQKCQPAGRIFKKMIFTANKQQYGQGLIEMLIVVVIVASCCMALFKFQMTLRYRDSLALQQSDATILALNKIESLRDFHVLTPQTPYAAYQDIVSGSSSTAGMNTTYTLTWTVTTNASPRYKVINVSVSWTDIRNNSQSVQLTTELAGIQPIFSASIIHG
jgi:Tfp pilus assembly protein PilV